MVDFKTLLSISKDKKQVRTVLEKKHLKLLNKAPELDGDQVVIPDNGLKSTHSAVNNTAADYVTGKSDTKPVIKFKKSKKSIITFSEVLARSKSQLIKKPKESKQSIIFGSGLTKRLAEQTEQQFKKEREIGQVVIPPDDKTLLTHALVAKDVTEPPEQPPIIKIETPTDIVWDKYQLSALEGLRHEKYACLIGAAGVGKTTVTKQIVAELEQFVPTIDLNVAKLGVGDDIEPDYNVAICFCAFTGRAVQQMKRPLPAAYHSLCNTIHATLGYAPVWETYFNDEANEYKEKMAFRPTFTAHNKLPFKICIVDEAGMVPIHLWNELIAALPSDCKIILIGDINQLPPVQGRSVLGFAMLNWPTYTLEHIHRQAADNPIIANAHKILRGLYPKKDAKKFLLLDLPDGSIDAQNKIIGIVQQLHKRDLFDPFIDALIVPQNKDNIGQLVLNERLVHYFNPLTEVEGVPINKRAIITAGYIHVHFAVGDKVMLLQNDRQRQLTNGMIGKVVSINSNGSYDVKRSDLSQIKFDGDLDIDVDKLEIKDDDEPPEKEDINQRQASHVMTVDFGIDDKSMEVTFSTAGQFKTVTLAYAFTCHKSQGGEYRNVVIVVHASNVRMLTREWLYTAVTRARERVVILSNDRGFAQAINVQRIKGQTVAEKAQQFLDLQDKSDTTLPNLPKPKKWNT